MKITLPATINRSLPMRFVYGYAAQSRNSTHQSSDALITQGGDVVCPRSFDCKFFISLLSRFRIFLCLAVFLLGACAPTVSIKREKGAVNRNVQAAIAGETTKTKIEHTPAEGNTPAKILAESLRERDKPRAAALCLEAAELAWQQLTTHPHDKQALAIYNAATEKFFSLIGCDLICSPTSLEFSTKTKCNKHGRTYRVLSQTPSGMVGYAVAAEIAVRGFQKRSTNRGLGSALVGVLPHSPEGSGDISFYPPHNNTALALNGLLVFETKNKSNTRSKTSDKIYEVKVVVNDVSRIETFRLGRARFPLAADFTAPLAVSMEGVNDFGAGLAGLLRPERAHSESGIYLSAPFDPAKIPVLLVHGLSGSPLMWRNMASELSADPAIRKNYQFLFAYYPSGIEVIATRLMLANWYDKFIRNFDPSGKSRASRDLVMIGHSMGGVLSRALSKNAENFVWDAFIKLPPEKIKLDKKDRDIINAALRWQAVPQAERGIYIAAPHHGAPLADSSFAKWLSSLIRLPFFLIEQQVELLQKLQYALRRKTDLRKYGTSISTLSPEFPLYAALDKCSENPYYRYHSIIGNRGEVRDLVQSNDGVVSYSSAHLPRATSELVVPTNHIMIVDNEQTIAEVRRILLLNLK